MIGRTLGHYTIEEQLGAGGMGVVYRATDNKLGRQVAIKVLPERVAKDPERLARFEREARVLASLNHPNIAAIHGLEDFEGHRYLVLELVPGPTLAQRLASGALPIDEALGVCRQVAEALEAAHDKGVVHRDLKPANIKITPEGRVKVLDFGLAKAMAPGAESSSPDAATLTLEATQPGTVLGTAAYMSPEQARGKPVDRRADIWAFGCVLYETLAGRRAFPGQTVSDFIASVLTREPDWDALPPATPRNLQALLRHCLHKDLQRRLRDIGDARIEVEEALAAPAAPALVEAAAPAARLRWAAAGMAAGLLAAALVAWLLWPAAGSGEVARFAIGLPAGESLDSGFASSVALSPDGARLVYATGTGLFLRRIDQLEAKLIPGTEGGYHPFFSPDGQWIGFRQAPRLRKVAFSGGAPVTICEHPGHQGSSWAPDGTIIFADMPSLWKVPAAGGAPQVLAAPDTAKGELSYRFPQILPGGKAVLYTIGASDSESFDDSRIGVLRLDNGEKKVLVEGGAYARYSPSGHIVYARAGALLAAPFDVKRLAITGSPVPFHEGVWEIVINGAAHFDVSPNGTLVYAPGSTAGATRQPVWVDRQGKPQPLPLPPRAYLHPRLSPDGRQVALEIEGPGHNLFTYDLDRGTLTKLTFDGVSHWPLWTPEGKRLTFRSWRTGSFTMWWMPADRSAGEERLTEIGAMQSPASWSPDGRVVTFNQISAETGPDVWVLEMTAERKPRPFAQTRFAEGSPKFSPDGKWIAYCSNESGRLEVYAQPYPGPGPKIQISTEGGSDPVWARNGKELFYRNGDRMMVVSVTLGPALGASRPRLLWEGHYSHGIGSSCGSPGPTSSNYDVTADGQRFLMIEDKDQDAAPRQVSVVLGFAKTLRTR
jgi:serine/threonine-protein kinase